MRAKYTPNTYTVKDDVVYLELGDKISTIDFQDLEEVLTYRWYVSCARKETATQKAYFRAISTTYGKSVFLHRLLMKAGEGEIIDHVDQNPLNNRRSNLRFCTASMNQRNRKARKTSSSKYRGCWWSKDKKRWVSQIRVNGKKLHLGSFKTEEEAGNAFSDAEAKYHSTWCPLFKGDV